MLDACGPPSLGPLVPPCSPSQGPPTGKEAPGGCHSTSASPLLTTVLHAPALRPGWSRRAAVLSIPCPTQVGAKSPLSPGRLSFRVYR